MGGKKTLHVNLTPGIDIKTKKFSERASKVSQRGLDVNQRRLIAAECQVGASVLVNIEAWMRIFDWIAPLNWLSSIIHWWFVPGRFFPSSSPSAFHLMTRHFCTYDCVLIEAWTTSRTHREKASSTTMEIAQRSNCRHGLIEWYVVLTEHAKTGNSTQVGLTGCTR